MNCLIHTFRDPGCLYVSLKYIQTSMSGWHADFLNHLGNRKANISHEVHHKTRTKFMNRKIILIRKQQTTLTHTL